MNLTRWLKARRKFVGLAAALGARLCLPGMSRAEAPAHKSVEVVFVLDTTGSMGGLLQGAKDKIWSIANEIAKGKPTPKVRMGIVAYRDRGDEYVTKDFDLTTNLDAMYKNLLTLKADGGGDTPEHVLKGIQDAVEKMSWSKNKDTFRVVYLVGDAPAHTNYGDTPTFEQLAQAALKKGVVINAIECGNDPQAAAQWQQLAKLGEGRFLAIAQNGAVAAVSTPFDDRLAALSRDLDGSMVAYGARRAKAAAEIKSYALMAKMAPASAAADRASFRAVAGSFGGASDLVEAVASNSVDLKAMKDEELPENMRGLSAEKRAQAVAEAAAKREKIRAEIGALSMQRSRYLREHAKTRGDSFDAALVDSLKVEAARKGIAY